MIMKGLSQQCITPRYVYLLILLCISFSMQSTAQVTPIDSSIYRMIDSINTQAEIERQANLQKAMLEGKASIGKLDLDVKRLFGYNHFEGFKLGLGLETNRKFSEKFQLGGYYQYGFKSETSQAGGFTKLFLGQYRSTVLEASYLEKLEENGSLFFLEERSLRKNTEPFRDFLLEDLFRQKVARVYLDFRPASFWQTAFFIEAGRHYQGFTGNTQDFDFKDVKVGLKLHYQYGEQLAFTHGRLKARPGTSPEIMLNISQGLDTWIGENSYTTTEIKIVDQLPWKAKGITNICFIGGKAMGDLPITRLYNGQGSYDNFFSLQADNSFTTMRFNEFAADQFASIFLRHNIGNILQGIHGQFFQPDLSFCFNAGLGNLKDKNSLNAQLQSFNEGYYEAGIQLEKILKSTFVDYGIGCYYRLGPYQLPDTKDNFALRLSLRIQRKRQ